MKTLFILAALCLPTSAQTWVKVATESNTFTVNTAVTVRYGASSGITTAGVDCSKTSCWALLNIASAKTISLNDATCCVFSVPDPAPGVAKELDVQEGPAAVLVTISGVAKTVPALPPPSLPVPITSTYAITCTAMATLTNGVMPATLPLTSQSCTAVKQ